MADEVDIERALARQQEIWAGPYGPPKAAELVAEARRRLAEDPGADLAAVLEALDPDDIDPDEAGTYRPAVG